MTATLSIDTLAHEALNAWNQHELQRKQEALKEENRRQIAGLNNILKRVSDTFHLRQSRLTATHIKFCNGSTAPAVLFDDYALYTHNEHTADLRVAFATPDGRWSPADTTLGDLQGTTPLVKLGKILATEGNREHTCRT